MAQTDEGTNPRTSGQDTSGHWRPSWRNGETKDHGTKPVQIVYMNSPGSTVRGASGEGLRYHGRETNPCRGRFTLFNTRLLANNDLATLLFQYVAERVEQPPLFTATKEVTVFKTEPAVQQIYTLFKLCNQGTTVVFST